ncbi:GntR family transcriptional regulator [Pollutimonas sp. M17]|uniref:GntR family transcriptional regulator n=1 Tax=Pollutimonas sp. M17 TaxID=2962065 RepID=UPI0021F4EFF4|nr:GntR family transcriptional regulator [Pollutimonas sp. M17]UYO93652.1 GntR family transcriptional regulator [Pollutimonas sp. M17]HWK71544.1 GntR family transcriptional regulator [Burkholderiaceae bacterium]
MNTQPPALSSSRLKEIDDDTLGASLNASSLADLAYQRIEAIILSGKLQGGERLNDSKLAKAFSISRGPVRSALARLADAGLVELIPYRGAFVRRIDLDDVMEIYDVRAAVERAGVLAASRNMTPEILERLAAYAADMDQSVGSGDREAYFKTNLAFHQLLHQTSGNSRLLELYERYTREQTLFRHFSLVTAGIEESNREHQRIVRALQAGDAQTAAHEMEAHVLSAKNRLEQTVKKVRDEYN